MGTAYTISPILKRRLTAIDALKQTILTTNLSTKTEQKLRWDAMTTRILHIFALHTHAKDKKDIERILREQKPPRNIDEKLILAYKTALALVAYDWRGTDAPVRIQHLQEYYKQLTNQTSLSNAKLSHILTYLQINQEHPVTQAGLAAIELRNVLPQGIEYQLLISLVTYLFLYKQCYDARGLLSIESFWMTEKKVWENMLASAIKKGTATTWLEYFALTVETECKKTLQVMESKAQQTHAASSFLDLHDRQKKILTIFEEPDKTITNRDIQKLFGISQITASRDLAKLATLGLIFSHGKGRSVYYTKL